MQVTETQYNIITNLLDKRAKKIKELSQIKQKHLKQGCLLTLQNKVALYRAYEQEIKELNYMLQEAGL